MQREFFTDTFITKSGGSHSDSNVLNRPDVMQSDKKDRVYLFVQELNGESDICQRNLPVRL